MLLVFLLDALFGRYGQPDKQVWLRYRPYREFPSSPIEPGRYIGERYGPMMPPQVLPLRRMWRRVKVIVGAVLTVTVLTGLVVTVFLP